MLFVAFLGWGSRSRFIIYNAFKSHYTLLIAEGIGVLIQKCMHFIEWCMSKYKNETKSHYSKQRFISGVVDKARSQNKADPRAQHGHTMFARTSVPENAEASRGIWGYASPENFEFLSFLGRF